MILCLPNHHQILFSTWYVNGLSIFKRVFSLSKRNIPIHEGIFPYLWRNISISWEEYFHLLKRILPLTVKKTVAALTLQYFFHDIFRAFWESFQNSQFFCKEQYFLWETFHPSWNKWRAEISQRFNALILELSD